MVSLGNGFGRIGRVSFRSMAMCPGDSIASLNDLCKQSRELNKILDAISTPASKELSHLNRSCCLSGFLHTSIMRRAILARVAAINNQIQHLTNILRILLVGFKNRECEIVRHWRPHMQSTTSDSEADVSLNGTVLESIGVQSASFQRKVLPRCQQSNILLWKYFITS